MFGTIILSLGSFMLTILLLVVYLFKMKESSSGNNLYTLLLAILIIVLGTEIISVYTIFHKDIMPIINEILCRVHCLSVLAWVLVLALYLLSLEKRNNINELKNYLFNELKLKRIAILFLGLVLIFFFLDFDYVILEDTAYISGPALYYSYFIGVIVFCIAVFKVIKKSEQLNFNKLPIIILIVETIISVPLSILIPDIYIITSSFAIKVFVLYFMAENPDLHVIRELEKAKEITENSNRTKTEFLSNVTIEIKNPVKTIIGLSESLSNKTELNKSEDLKSIKYIYSASNNLLEIINNVLDLSRIETSSEAVIEETYELKKILSELISIIGARVDKRVTFNVIVDDNVPSKYMGDKNKIFKILLNLLSNAVKYTEVGKITLRCSYKIDNKKSMLCFKITDTGTGIKEEDYNKLFSKFSRLDYAVKNEIEGLGLGLVLTKRLVDLLEGRIWFDSIYGVGSNFYVELEQKVIESTPLGDLSSEYASGKEMEYIDLSSKKVLLVDDNKLNLKVAEKLLKFYKLNIESVTSGKDAIYKIKEGNVYDIIFLDHMMPEMDGIEVMHIMKKLAKTFDIPPIVALTANAITGMKEMYLSEGFDDYLAKPINISELDKIIHKYFKEE